eukprot:s2497_g2.t1
MAVPPQVLSLPGDILREASKSSAEVFGDIKTFLLLLGDERCKSMKAVGPGKIELIVVVETVVLHILIQVWDGDDECSASGATSWVSFRDLFRQDSIRLHKFARFLEGSWNSFSTVQFSANSLDESDLEELNSDEEPGDAMGHSSHSTQNPLKEGENIWA